LGLLPVLAIEGPDTLKPTPPPAVVEDEAAVNTPPEEAPRENEVAPPEDLSRAYLGIGTGELPALLAEHLKLPFGGGVVVHTLDPEGPAAKAGLVENDIVTEVAGKTVGSQDSLRDVVTAHKPGEEVEIKYIHRGDAKSIRVGLTKAPAEAPRIAGRNTPPVDRLRMNGMPEDQARLLLEALEHNRRQMEELTDDQLMDPGGVIGRGMHGRLQEMLKGLENFPGDGAKDGGNGFSFNIGGTIRMMDDQGSVEVNSNNGKKKVRVLGRDGKVQWEGPYNTEEDKAKVPDDVRERIEHLNIDMDFKGNGIRLGPRPQR
jgi:hypothetical protein